LTSTSGRTTARAPIAAAHAAVAQATGRQRGEGRSGRRTLKDEKLARLSPQEERILSLVAAGRTNRQIGEEMHLAEKTVKNYVSSILTKLEVARRAEAAAYLARHGTPPRA
jgi:two-component system, NarL family, response regulator DevR